MNRTTQKKSAIVEGLVTAAFIVALIVCFSVFWEIQTRKRLTNC